MVRLPSRRRVHDKIGATAYASLDKKGTEQKIHISRKARIVPGICFRTALWMIAGDTLAKFPANGDNEAFAV